MTINWMEETLVFPGHPKTRNITFLDGWTPPLLIRTLADDELPADLRKSRPNESQGWPQTVGLITDKEKIPMTREIQEWLFALNPGLARAAFADMLDTWNTGSKVGDSANFITGENLKKELPKYPADLTFGCNTFRVKQYIALTDLYEIESVNVNSLPEPTTLPIYQRTHLTIFIGGKVNPFPQNGGRDGKPCYTAPLSASPLFIERRRCEVVDGVENPYSPPFDY